MVQRKIPVLCVDDNYLVATALQGLIDGAADLACIGTLPTADTLVTEAQRLKPQIVLLDIDMPGKSPFAAMVELSNEMPDVRVIMHSGFASEDLISQALDAGAWGYVHKGDGPDALLEAIRGVASGNMVLSSIVRSTWHQ